MERRGRHETLSVSPSLLKRKIAMLTMADVKSTTFQESNTTSRNPRVKLKIAAKVH